MHLSCVSVSEPELLYTRLTSPFSGGSPLPNVLVTTSTSVSCSRSTTSYSSIEVTCRRDKKEHHAAGILAFARVVWPSPRRTVHTADDSSTQIKAEHTAAGRGGGCNDYSVLASNEMIMCCCRTASVHDAHHSTRWCLPATEHTWISHTHTLTRPQRHTTSGVKRKQALARQQRRSAPGVRVCPVIHLQTPTLGDTHIRTLACAHLLLND